MAIEKKFVREQVNRLLIKEFLKGETERAGFGGIDIQRTPMGTRVSLVAERPGMIIGRRGSNISRLTADLASNFNAENPQIEVIEAGRNANLNANIMARKVAEALERGWHFRRAGHSTVRRIMESGAKGCIVILSGKLTGQRHRVEKFIQGHIKYNGDTALNLMDVGYAQCKKKLGTIGCTVKIMHPDARLPDEVTVYAPGEKDMLEQAKHRPEPKHVDEKAEQAAAEGEAKPEPAEEEKERRPRRREPAPQPTEADIAEAEALAKRRAAEKTQQAKPEEAAEAAAPATADVTPEAKPEAAPEPTPDPTPEPTPEPTAEATPEATPEPEAPAEGAPETEAAAEPAKESESKKKEEEATEDEAAAAAPAEEPEKQEES